MIDDTTLTLEQQIAALKTDLLSKISLDIDKVLEGVRVYDPRTPYLHELAWDTTNDFEDKVYRVLAAHFKTHPEQWEKVADEPELDEDDWELPFIQTGYYHHTDFVGAVGPDSKTVLYRKAVSND